MPLHVGFNAFPEFALSLTLTMNGCSRNQRSLSQLAIHLHKNIRLLASSGSEPSSPALTFNVLADMPLGTHLHAGSRINEAFGFSLYQVASPYFFLQIRFPTGFLSFPYLHLLLAKSSTCEIYCGVKEYKRLD